MDGTIYLGGTLFDWTPGFLSTLRQLGIGYTFLTNNSSRSKQHYVEHLKQMGILIDESMMYTSADSAAHYLRDNFPEIGKLFVLGTPSLQDEMADYGYAVVNDNPEAVVVGFDTGLVYDRLCAAAYHISLGCPFVATHPDFVCPTDQPTVLVDCGSICAALTAATGIEPVVLGKPDPVMLRGILEEHNLEVDQLGMVGDRLYTDMAMAARTGALGILVLSGEATREDVEACTERPDLVVEDVGRLGALLREART